MSAKEDILARINAAAESENNTIEPEWESEELVLSDYDLSLAFKHELEKVSGMFYEVVDFAQAGELIRSFQEELKQDTVYCALPELAEKLSISGSVNADSSAVISCEFLIASTGSVLVSSATMQGRKHMVLPPIVYVVAQKNQLVPYLKDGINALKQKYSHLPSLVSLITGPSRTADIEKTLVLGAHGPKKLIVLLLPENN